MKATGEEMSSHERPHQQAALALLAKVADAAEHLIFHANETTDAVARRDLHDALQAMRKRA
jgi:hypothetical protein